MKNRLEVGTVLRELRLSNIQCKFEAEQLATEQNFQVRLDDVLGRHAVNFINILRTNFSYERHFFHESVTREKLPKGRSYEKCTRLTLMELTHVRLFKIMLSRSMLFTSKLLTV